MTHIKQAVHRALRLMVAAVWARIAFLLCMPSRAALIRRSFGINAVRTIAAAYILLCAFPASADTPSPSSPAAASDSGLEEIIVSAQRRDESLQKVPMSLTAMSQKSLDDLHIESFQDIATIVPGVVIPTPPGGFQSATNIAIRGIISENNAQTTAIYIDETPIVTRQNTSIGFNGTPQPDIFDLARVEVLRGPQGTLFGSSAMGGAIRYITPQPDLNTSSGYSKAEVSYTDHGDPSYAVGVAYGAPVVEGVAAFRLSGWFHRDGGFIDIEDPYTAEILNHNANSSDAYTVRPAFTVAPVEGLTITPALFLQQKKSAESNSYWLTEMPNPNAAPFVTGFGATTPQPAQDNLSVSSLAIKYDFSSLSFASDTSYLDRRFRSVDDWTNLIVAQIGGSSLNPSLPAFSSASTNITSTNAWQQEFRLSSAPGDSRLGWVAGLYYRRAVDELSQSVSPDMTPLTELIAGETSAEYFGIPNYVLNGQVLAAYSTFSTVTEQRALFGEVTYEIAPHLKANVGLRVEHAALYDQKQIIAGPLNGYSYLNTVLPDDKEKPVTPRFGLTYQYTDTDMVYVTAAKGYRLGGSNSPVVTENPLCTSSATALGYTSVPLNYKSDSLWSYELGAKDSLFNQRLAFQASVFYIDWTNIQTTEELPSCLNGFTTNFGKAVSKGFDLQFEAIVMDGLKLGGNVAYTDAYLVNAAYGAPSNGVIPLLNGSGDKLPNVLPWTASANLEYSRDIGPLWADARSYLRLDYRWLDAGPRGNPAVAGYDPTTESVGGTPAPNQAYGTLNIRLGVTHGGLDLSAFVNNITNADPILGYSHSTTTPSSPLFYATAIRPLTSGFTALYRY
jgi:iron complex outermembrane recepter protein